MIFKLRLGRWKFTASFAAVTDVTGMNSKLPDGNHFLMWDFDDLPLQIVIASLWVVQKRYDLPTIYVAQTKEKEGYHAYCLKRLPFRHAVEILAATPNTDYGHFKYGVLREQFTLRISPKCGRKVKLLTWLPSKIPEDVSVAELRNFVKYETLEDGQGVKVIELPGGAEVRP